MRWSLHHPEQTAACSASTLWWSLGKTPKQFCIMWSPLCLESTRTVGAILSPYCSTLSRVSGICCGVTKTILNLARSLLFYYTKLPWYSHSLQGSPRHPSAVVLSPSLSSIVETPRTWTTVDIRLSTWRHVPSHAPACAIPRLARVLPDTFRSYVT